MSLPDVLIFRILSFLPCSNLSTVSLTCSRLLNIATDPYLWSRYAIVSEHILKDMSTFFETRRLRKLREICISSKRRMRIPMEDLDMLFQYFLQNENLRKVRLENVYLDSVPGFPFSAGLSRVSSLSLPYCALDTEQLTALLTRMIKWGRLVDHLNLSSNSLHHVAADLISKAGSLCRSLDLSLTDLKPQAIKDLLEGIDIAVTKELNLSDLNLQEVNTQSLAHKLSTMKSLVLSDVIIREEQLQQLFFCLLKREDLGENIDLSGVNLSSIEPTLLGPALASYKVLNLRNCWLSTQQISSIIESLENGSSVEEVDLSGNNCSELNSLQLLTAAYLLNTLTLKSAKVGSNVLLEYVSACQETAEASGSIVFSTADFPSSHLQKQLSAAFSIVLHREPMSYYADEKSCEYGDLFDNPI